MSWSAVIVGKKTVPLATISGWAEAKQWIGTLSVEEAPLLIHFAEHAWADRTGDMRREILAALKKHPPNNDVRAIMSDLAKELRGTKDDDAIYVSDGISEDDGDEIVDEWVVGEYDPPATDETPARQRSRGRDPLFSNPTTKARKRKPAKRKAAKPKPAERKTTAPKPKRKKPAQRTVKRQ